MRPTPRLPYPEPTPSKLAGLGRTLARSRKAIVAFVAPGAVTIGAAVLEGSPGGEAITRGEWVGAAAACVVTAAAVYRTPNARAAADEG